MKAPKQMSRVKKKATPDRFSIYLTLRHESSDLAHVSNVLSMKPAYYRVGKRVSYWRTVFAEGSGVTGFSKALKTLVSVLTRHRTFFDDFTSSGGGVEVTLNHYADVDAVTDFLDPGEARTGLTLFEVELYPGFTQITAEMGITLRLCVLAA
jgi:hypothetical protein